MVSRLLSRWPLRVARAMEAVSLKGTVAFGIEGLALKRES
jgi:hypothetical protein